MKIISQFKDYYDHQAHIYGGGDPKIVYDRKPLSEVRVQHTTRYYPEVEVHLAAFYKFQYELQHRRFDTRITYLIVCGIAYAMVSVEVDGKFLAPVFYEESLHEDRVYDIAQNKYRMIRQADYIILCGTQSDVLIEISRKLNSPVFVISGVSRPTATTTKFHIRGDCPKLSDLGFASIKSPEQLYQDISYFVGNTMLTPTPDNMPTVNMSDREKILSHGLDLKKSFRHRL